MSTSTTDRVVVVVQDAIAHLRFVRHDAGNAIDPAWLTAFDEAVASIEGALAAPGGREAVRVVLMQAEGRAFTVGGDLTYFGAAGDRLSAELAAMAAKFNGILLRLSELPVPVVAGIGGPIAGGGMGIAWAADVVIASPAAKFAAGFHRIGLSGDGGSSWYLPRLVGMRRAQEILMRGRVLDAQEALDWGLVTELVPADDLDERALAVASELAAGPSLALGRMRALLRGSYDIPLAEHFAREAQEMGSSGATEDAVEGIGSFVERRPPRFGAR